MRKYFFILLFTLLAIAGYTQPTTFRAAYQSIISTTPANGGTYASQGFFFDSDGLGYSVSDIKVDTTILQDNRGYLYRIVYKSGTSPVTLEFDPIEGATDMITGYAIIGDPIGFDLTSNILPEIGDDINNKNRASSETRFREKILSADSTLQAQIDAVTSGGNLAIADQLLTEDRLISGSDLYDLTLDSILVYYNHADEVFITSGPTDLLTVIGTTNRWNEDNSGFIKYNSLSVVGSYTQTVSNDSIARLYTSPGSAGIITMDREGATTNYSGADLNVKAEEIWARVFDSSNFTDAEVRIGSGRVEINALDSILIGVDDFNESLPVVLAIDTATNRVYRKTINLSGITYDTYTYGVLTASAVRSGGTVTTISNAGAGQYQFVANNGGFLDEIDIVGNNTTLTGASEVIVIVDNTTNSRERLYTVQIIDRNSNTIVNPFALGCNITQVVSGYITTISISNLNNGFGSAGYKILLR